LPKIMSVLRVKRQIQTKDVTQLRQLSGGSALPEHLLDGVPWHDVNHQENKRQNEPKSWERKQKSFNKVTRHCGCRPKISLG
jgi:hypothetical protein